MHRIFFLFVSFISCSNIDGYNENRVDLIKTAVGLIERGSIDSLKMIVDTNHVYKLYSREGFEGKMLRAQQNMAACAIPHFDEYKISQPIYQITEYTLQFCRSKDDSITDSSFDLVFTFYDYEDTELIKVLNMHSYAMPKRAAEPPPGM